MPNRKIIHTFDNKLMGCGIDIESKNQILEDRLSWHCARFGLQVEAALAVTTKFTRDCIGQILPTGASRSEELDFKANLPI
ncbi:hypothetical protein Thiowin_03110 [Thiorhodovibrio winogradskyi]|uniref:Uncharacterized protein n=1 Tax=Thiorhodovibrio winogradskyi TaxID=77007 RepID=A0ABZ0SCM3_9GAMM